MWDQGIAFPTPLIAPIENKRLFRKFPNVAGFLERAIAEALADFRVAVDAFDNPEILNVVDDLEDDIRRAFRRAVAGTVANA